MNLYEISKNFELLLYKLVFYYKVTGDYNRYMLEVATGELRNYYKQQLDEAYETCYRIVSEKIPITNPIRLGLALSQSTYLDEILQDSSKACELAKKTFDEAISQLDTLSDDKWKDILPILQLLRDKLTLWTSGDDDDQDE